MWSRLFGAKREARRVLVYTRQGCHLCDDALALLEGLSGRYRLRISTVDIDAEPGLVEQYNECVPVVLIDERVRFRGVMNRVLLERVLRAAPGCAGANGDEEAR